MNITSMESPEDRERLQAKLRHDLNNPLTAIMGAAELILIKEKHLSEEGRKRVEMILGACTRMSEMLRTPPAGGGEGR